MLSAERFFMPSSETSPSSETRRFEGIPFQDAAAAHLSLDRVTARLSPALSRALPALLAESPDPDSSLLLFERLVSESSAETVRLLETHQFLAHYAIAVFGHSRYLGETLVQNADLVHTFFRE
jgi:glutamine synthetase adenylyltransferase